MKKKLLSLLFVGVLLVVSAVPVFANTLAEEPQPPIQVEGNRDLANDIPIRDRITGLLETVYERSGKLVEHVGDDLARAENIEERLTKAIERYEELGEDTSEVQRALDEFLAKVLEIEAGYNNVLDIYNTPAGFDADGQVTDIDDAIDSMQALIDSLQTSHQEWHEATASLREVLEAYQEAHPRVEE
jgi:peptidoglycan hydrolase CwlO-like protein